MRGRNTSDSRDIFHNKRKVRILPGQSTNITQGGWSIDAEGDSYQSGIAVAQEVDAYVAERNIDQAIARLQRLKNAESDISTNATDISTNASDIQNAETDIQNINTNLVNALLVLASSISSLQSQLDSLGNMAYYDDVGKLSFGDLTTTAGTNLTYDASNDTLNG